MLRNRGHRFGLLGNEQRVDLSAERGDLLHRRGEAGGCVAFDRHHPHAALCGDLLEFSEGDVAVIVLWDERRDRPFTPRRGEIDDPVDIAFDQE